MIVFMLLLQNQLHAGVSGKVDYGQVFGIVLLAGAAWPLVPAGVTTGIGNAINTDKSKGDFGASYLGALGGTFVGLALAYFIDQAFPKGQSYLLAWVFLGSFGGAVAGYMLSIPESATGSGASNSATNIRYLQLGAMSF